MIAWNKSLEIGIDKIDQQHRSLIQTLEDLYDACSRGEGMQEMRYVISFLEWYVEKHFKDEELIQKRYLYPGYKAHHSSHDYYINEVNQLGINFNQDPHNTEHLSSVIAYLTKMIKHHITYEDRAFADYMN
ncbi:MAG: bacteriohemerythrin, partial [Cellulosilyticaceae bacterium]